MRLKAEENRAIARNRIFKELRKKNTLEEVNDRRGNTVYLNLTKRILFDKPYKNEEYEAERMRKMKKIMSQIEEAVKKENQTEEKE